MNLRVQSDTTSILVRQLTCLLNIRKSCKKSDQNKIAYLDKEEHVEQQKHQKQKIITLHIQNTRATDCCDPLKPSLQVALHLPDLLLKEQIARNACTLHSQVASTSWVRKAKQKAEGSKRKTWKCICKAPSPAAFPRKSVYGIDNVWTLEWTYPRKSGILLWVGVAEKRATLLLFLMLRYEQAKMKTSIVYHCHERTTKRIIIPFWFRNFIHFPCFWRARSMCPGHLNLLKYNRIFLTVIGIRKVEPRTCLRMISICTIDSQGTIHNYYIFFNPGKTLIKLITLSKLL